LDKEPIIYINGEYYPKSEAKVSVYDHGFLYGDGVFEGIRAYNGVVFKLKEHLKRLYSSAKTIMLNIPMSMDELEKAVIETLKKNELRDAYIRLIVTRGIGDLGLDPRRCGKPSIVIIAEPMILLHAGELKKKGIRTIISWVRRDPVDATSHEVKTLNYMNSILAKLEANNAGVDEAICLDTKGNVSEGAAENLFIVKDGKIFTPPMSTGALAGITRNVIINLARRLGYEVHEKNITPTELFNADEVFFTGTAAEVVPVREVNGRVIGDGKAGPITLRLQSEFMELAKSGKEGTPIE